MKKILLIIACFIFSSTIFSQNFSNKGKDFWLGYGYHVSMSNTASATFSPLSTGGSQEMVLYFTSDKNANVTVEIPAVGYLKTYSVIANQVTETTALPKTGTQDARISDTGYFNRGIHVYSDVDIVAYAHIYNGSISGATLLYPTNTLGKEYYSINYNQQTNSPFGYSFAFVVATEDNTTVEITPSVANKNNKTVGLPFTVNLNKGQIYNIFGTNTNTGCNATGVSCTGSNGSDLTGTRIRSVSNSGSCKKIAVFSGSGKMSIGGSTQSGSADNFFAQSLPASAWGLKYLTAPTGTQPNNYFRICVTDPTTVVKLNGTVISASLLQRNFFYELKNSTPLSVPGNGTSVTNTTSGVWNLIEADKPINVAQFTPTQNTDGNGTPGDPEMIYLSPVEQTINNITLNSTTHANITVHGINVIIKKGGVNSFKLDGVNKASSFITHPRDANYAYAIFPVSSGAHNLYSDTGFNAIAYGFGSAESYGYNAGTNIKDLYTPVFQNPYARLSFAATCVGTPFQFSVPFSYQPTSLTWDFGGAANTNLSPNTTIGPVTPVYDSATVIGGQNLYYYSPANGTGTKTFIYSKTGTDTIKLYANNPTPDGCGSTNAEYDIPVVINNIPNANFSVSAVRCISDSIPFTDASTGLGLSNVVNGLWYWGDGTQDSLKNPLHKFNLPKTYNIRYRPITDFGCIGDTTIAFDLAAAPIAKFGINDTTCVGNIISFTDSSSIAGGSIVKWYWDYGNGIKDTLSTNVIRTQVYNTAGVYTVSLIVENNTGCKSNAFTKNLVIHPYPIPNFTIPTVVCLPKGAATFTNTTTIIDTSTTFKYAWNFGDGGIDSVKNPTHNFATVGPLNVKLTATSVFGCVKDTTKSIATIYPQAKANFSVVNQPCFRDTTYFKDSTDGKGSSITKWRWSFGDGSIDTLQNPSHRYAASGSYNVSLYTVTDKGCNSDTITKTATVNPLPQVGFTATATAYCETRPVTFTDTSKIATGNITRWYWQLGDNSVVDTTNGNPFTHSYATYGSYTVKHMAESDKGCKSDTVSQTVTVNPLPQVGFIVPEICLADAAAQFTDTSKIADGSQASFTYSWNLNVTGITPVPTPFTALTVKNPSAKYYKSDNYQVSETVTSNKGCAVTLQQPFTVNGSIPVPGFAVQNAGKLCANDSVAIQDTSYIDFGNITKVEIVWDNLNNPTVKEIDDNPTSGHNKLGKLYKHLYPNFYNPQAPKTIQIKFTAYSGNVCVNSITKNITLNPSPRVQFTVMPGICKDASPRQITQATETTGIAGAFVYTGTATNSTGTITPSSTAVGTYNIQYKYTSTAGCADSATQPITIWPSPVAKWGISSPICEKNNITFTDSSQANYSKIASWQWTYGDGNSSTKTTGTAYTYSYAAAGTYTASLRVTTDSGCNSQVNSQTIKVNYLPKVSFTMPTICLPDGNGTFTSTSTIADGSQSLFSYSWNFGDPNNATGSTSQSATHQYSALAPTGGYPVKLIITSKDGCKDSLTQAYSDVNPQPTAAFTATPTAVCVKDKISFTDKSNGKTSAVTTWYWDIAQGQSSNVQNPSRQFNDSGTYQIRLWVDNAQGCRSDTATQSVTIHPYPILELGPNLVVLEGGTIALKPQTVYGNNLSYLWTAIAPAGSPTYLSSDTAAVPMCTPIASVDSITYKLQLTGIGGCAVNDQITVVVLHTPVIPNTFTPNGDNNHDTWVIKSLESYPGATIEIYNRYGQLVYKTTGYDPNNAWDGKLNGVPLPVGTYYYIINPKNGRSTLSGSVTIIR